MDAIIRDLSTHVQGGAIEKVTELVGMALDRGIPAMEILEGALRPAMEEVSFVYDQVTWTYAIGGATHTDSRPAQLPPAPGP